MPEVWRKTARNFKIIIWQSSEVVEELFNLAQMNERDLDTYSSFQSETRKREWVTVRVALRHLFKDHNESIVYNQNGRPELVAGNSISISHSGEFIAIMVSDEGIVGIDIEKIHPRIEILSRKFVTNEEYLFLDSSRIEKIHVIWGAKEVLYKIYSKGGVDFKKDLKVFPFNFNTEGTCKALIKKNDFENSFDVYYRVMNEYMITWSMLNAADTENQNSK